MSTPLRRSRCGLSKSHHLEGCPRGSSCSFSHPLGAARGRGRGSPNDCRYLSRELVCPHGCHASIRFCHRFSRTGHCEFGTSCRWFHDPRSARPGNQEQAPRPPPRSASEGHTPGGTPPGDSNHLTVDSFTLRRLQTLGLGAHQFSRTSVRAAFQGMARTAHPDKGGDPAQFCAIFEAYTVLLEHPSLR